MKINTRENKTYSKITVDQQFNGAVEFAQFLIEYIEGIANENFKLIKKEREFLVATVVLSNEGININSKQAVDAYLDRFGFSTARMVYDYRRALVGKGWIVRNKKKLELRDFFSFKNYREDTEFTLKVRFNEVTR